MKWSLLLLAPLAALATSGPACADFRISIGDATIARGGSGSVDVTIASDNTAGDPLSSANFKFEIIPAGVGGLQFVSPQADSQLSQASYVFFGNSADLIGGTRVGNVSTTSALNDTFVGNDGTNDGSNATVTTSLLLATLDFSAAGVGLPLGGTATFSVVLVPDAFTSFLDSNLAPVAFTSTPGTVTVTNAVPEPTSLALFSTTALSILIVGRRTRRGRARSF